MHTDFGEILNTEILLKSLNNVMSTSYIIKKETLFNMTQLAIKNITIKNKNNHK
jgi:hypothetical protein